MSNSKISREMWVDYIYALYFGAGDPLSNCINRAYKDFSRTLHGFGKVPNADDYTKNAKEYLYSVLREFPKLHIETQEKFNLWHHETCIGLIAIYPKYNDINTNDATEKNLFKFHIGQAQKWINMSLKYIHAYGETKLEDYEKTYRFCHIPIDNYILEALRKEGLEISIGSAWSRMEDYEKSYLGFQKQVSQYYHDQPLLDVEFQLWLDMRNTKFN